MATLNDLIEKGMAFFTGQTVPKSDLEAANQRIAVLEKASIGAADLTKALEQSQQDIATAKTTIGTLEKKVEDQASQIATITKERDEAKAAIEPRAAQRAHEITAAQGQPPIAVKPSETPAKPSTGTNWTERCLAEKAKQSAK